MKKEKANFVYQFSGTFDPNVDVFSKEELKQLEIRKYKARVTNEIERIKKELQSKKKKSVKKELEEKINKSKLLFEQFVSMRGVTFEFAKNEIYPKEVPYPTIHFIQYPEPNYIYDVSGFYKKPQEWYDIMGFIEEFAEQSYLCYEMGMWLASISSAINCCEYILKYELFRFLNKNPEDNEILKQMSNNYRLTFGKLLKDNVSGKKKTTLELLGINELFKDKFEYLDLIRGSLYHFNPEKFEEAQSKGELESKHKARLDSDITTPIFAYRVYMIMIEVLNHFYSKEKHLEYLMESKVTWEKENE